MPHLAMRCTLAIICRILPNEERHSMDSRPSKLRWSIAVAYVCMHRLTELLTSSVSLDFHDNCHHRQTVISLDANACRSPSLFWRYRLPAGSTLLASSRLTTSSTLAASHWRRHNLLSGRRRRVFFGSRTKCDEQNSLGRRPIDYLVREDGRQTFKNTQMTIMIREDGRQTFQNKQSVIIRENPSQQRAW